MIRNKSRELLIKDGHAVTTDPAEPVPPIELQQREVLHLTPDPLACPSPIWDGMAGPVCRYSYGPFCRGPPPGRRPPSPEPRLRRRRERTPVALGQKTLARRVAERRHAAFQR